MITPKKLSSTEIEIINQSILDELDAHYFYLSASNWAQNAGYVGAAKFFLDESKSEQKHYQKHADFLTGFNSIPALPKIDAPDSSFSGYVDLFEKAYEMENELMRSYNLRSTKLQSGGFWTTFDHLTFFRKIQADSVMEYSDLLNKLSLSGSDRFALFYFDNTVLK